MPNSWDVLVVGAGPGGALAAKRCAEDGFRTLLLEKKKMPRDKCCSGMVMGEWGQEILRQEFVIGADGGGSWVRRALFPELETVALHGYRECYEAVLDLPSKRFNIFATMGIDPMFFAHQKGSYLLLEGVAFPGGFEQALAHARRFLVENHGLDPNQAPLSRDGCVQPAIQHASSGGSFLPARGNVLIVGDAAGLNAPVTGEGLNMALKSGLEAARAVAKARQSGTQAAGIYLKVVDELLARFREIEVFGRRIGTAAATEDPEAYADALIESWDYALKAF
jgi:flavin-dependent dehydrogenase